MGDLTQVDAWSLVQRRTELEFEDVDPDGLGLELHEMSLEQLARWLALTTEIAARGWTAFDGREAERVAFARVLVAERLQWQAEGGLRCLPTELAGIPLDPQLIPPAFRQNLTPFADQLMVPENAFSTSTGGAL
jgi:hypothetical protein